MKKLIIFLMAVCVSLDVCLIVYAENCAVFGPSSSTYSYNNMTPVQATNNNYYNYNRYHNYRNSNNNYNYLYGANYYPNQYYNYQYSGSYLTSYIFSRSLCNYTVYSYLRGRSISNNNNDTRYHLSNGQIWKQYIPFNGQIVENTPSVYKYSAYNVYPSAKIYRDQATNSCKLMINDVDTGIYVYREN